eukprot:9225521-Pyramimonas_sp.AAC.1
MASLTGTAASQVETYKDKIETALVEFEWTDSPRIVISIPLSTFVKGFFSMMMMMIALLGFVCYAILKSAGAEKPVPALPEPEPEKECVQTKAPKEKK